MILIIIFVVILTLILFIIFRNKLAEWSKKYDKLLGILLSFVLVCLTAFYAYTTQSILKQTEQQSDRQIKLSQNPIIGFKYLDYQCHNFSDIFIRNRSPFIDNNVLKFRFEMTNLSNAPAIDIKVKINLVTVFKNKKVIEIEPVIGFKNSSLYGPYAQIAYFKIIEVETLQALITGKDFLSMIGSNSPDSLVYINSNLINIAQADIHEIYFDIQCVYSNTLGQKFKTSDKLVMSLYPNYQLIDRVSTLKNIFDLAEWSSNLDAQPIDLKTYQSILTSIDGSNDNGSHKQNRHYFYDPIKGMTERNDYYNWEP